MQSIEKLSRFIYDRRWMLLAGIIGSRSIKRILCIGIIAILFAVFFSPISSAGSNGLNDAAMEYEILDDGSFELNAKPNPMKNFVTLEWESEYGDKEYQIYKKEIGGSTEFEAVSANYDKHIKVLNVYPAGAKGWIKGWMQDMKTYLRDVEKRSDWDFITVDEVVMTRPDTTAGHTKEEYARPFNEDPNYYLKYQDGENAGEYKYDVIFYGVSDGNGQIGQSGPDTEQGTVPTKCGILNNDLSDIAFTAMCDYLDSGRGFVFGHDTVFYNEYYKANNKNMNEIARRYGGMLQGYISTAVSSNGLDGGTGKGIIKTFAPFNNNAGYYDFISSQYVKVAVSGPLTNYPFRIDTNNIGKGTTVLTVPLSHMLGQLVSGKVWLQFSDSGGKLVNQTVHNYNTNGEIGPSTNNAFLSTFKNTALIQTGNMINKYNTYTNYKTYEQLKNASGYATLDEKRIIANTLFFLAQVTKDTYAYDRTANDRAKPEVLNAIFQPNDQGEYKSVKFAGKDNGTTYHYYITKQSNTTGESQSNTIKTSVTSGLKGYIVMESNSPTESLPTADVDKNGNLALYSTGGSGSILNSFTNNQKSITVDDKIYTFIDKDEIFQLKDIKQAYVYAWPVDMVNNVGAVKMVHYTLDKATLQIKFKEIEAGSGMISDCESAAFVPETIYSFEGEEFTYKLPQETFERTGYKFIKAAFTGNGYTKEYEAKDFSNNSIQFNLRKNENELIVYIEKEYVTVNFIYYDTANETQIQKEDIVPEEENSLPVSIRVQKNTRFDLAPPSLTNWIYLSSIPSSSFIVSAEKTVAYSYIRQTAPVTLKNIFTYQDEAGITRTGLLDEFDLGTSYAGKSFVYPSNSTLTKENKRDYSNSSGKYYAYDYIKSYPYNSANGQVKNDQVILNYVYPLDEKNISGQEEIMNNNTIIQEYAERKETLTIYYVIREDNAVYTMLGKSSQIIKAGDKYTFNITNNLSDLSYVENFNAIVTEKKQTGGLHNTIAVSNTENANHKDVVSKTIFRKDDPSVSATQKANTVIVVYKRIDPQPATPDNKGQNGGGKNGTNDDLKVIYNKDKDIYEVYEKGTPLGYIKLKKGQSITNVAIYDMLIPYEYNPKTGDFGFDMNLPLLIALVAVLLFALFRNEQTVALKLHRKHR